MGEERGPIGALAEEMNPDLSIIIVNWNAEEYLKGCIKSVYSNIGKAAFEIIVIDNASTDNSLAMLKNNFPDVRVVKSSVNIGFARANNQAMKVSRGRYVLLLNPDTIVSDDAFFKMMNFMADNPAVGAIGAKLALPGGSLEAGAAGYKFSMFTAFNYYFFLSKLFPRIFRGLYLDQNYFQKDPVVVDWVSGACMMLRRELLNRGIIFSEDFFMYVEDVELCDRIRKDGWKIYYLPMAKVVHFRGGSVKKMTTEPEVMQVKALGRYFRKNYGMFATNILYIYSIFGFFLRFVMYRMVSHGAKKKYHQDKAAELKKYMMASIRLLFDAVISKAG